MNQTPHTLEAMQRLKRSLTSGFVFLRGWFLIIWSLLVFFAREFRCVHSSTVPCSSRLHTRGNCCRLLFLPTHCENNRSKCLLLTSTQNDQHFYKHKFYSWKMVKDCADSQLSQLYESLWRLKLQKLFFKIKVQWNRLKTLDLTLCRLHDLFIYLFIRVWASIGPEREV